VLFQTLTLRENPADFKNRHDNPSDMFNDLRIYVFTLKSYKRIMETHMYFLELLQFKKLLTYMHIVSCGGLGGTHQLLCCS